MRCSALGDVPFARFISTFISRTNARCFLARPNHVGTPVDRRATYKSTRNARFDRTTHPDCTSLQWWRRPKRTRLVKIETWRRSSPLPWYYLHTCSLRRKVSAHYSDETSSPPREPLRVREHGLQIESLIKTSTSTIVSRNLCAQRVYTMLLLYGYASFHERRRSTADINRARVNNTKHAGGGYSIMSYRAGTTLRLKSDGAINNDACWTRDRTNVFVGWNSPNGNSTGSGLVRSTDGSVPAVSGRPAGSFERRFTYGPAIDIRTRLDTKRASDV